MAIELKQTLTETNVAELDRIWTAQWTNTKSGSFLNRKLIFSSNQQSMCLNPTSNGTQRNSTMASHTNLLKLIRLNDNERQVSNGAKPAAHWTICVHDVELKVTEGVVWTAFAELTVCRHWIFNWRRKASWRPLQHTFLCCLRSHCSMDLKLQTYSQCLSTVWTEANSKDLNAHAEKQKCSSQRINTNLKLTNLRWNLTQHLNNSCLKIKLVSTLKLKISFWTFTNT